MSIDSNAADIGPKEDYRPVVFLFYFIYIIILAFFMINIFVGFVIVTFQSEGEADFKNCPLDKNQRNCIEFALNAKPIKLYIPKNPLQYKLWAFATSPLCENTVFFAIVLNTISLAMKFYHQPEWYTDFLDVLNLFFTFFGLDAIHQKRIDHIKVATVGNPLIVDASLTAATVIATATAVAELKPPSSIA